MNENNKLYHEQLTKYIEQVRANKYYSHQRLDILVIILATSGIFVLSNLLMNKDYQIGALKVSLVFFSMAIILNILSQVIASESHAVIEKIYTDKANELRDSDDIKEHNYKKKESRYRSLAVLIIGFNYGSLIFLLLAIVISTFSFISTF